MSWDRYIDDVVALSKDAYGAAHCDRACIIALDGGALLTTSSHPNELKLNVYERSFTADCLKSKDFKAFQENGVYAEGIKYLFLREEEGKTVFAKIKDHGAIALQASKTAIVIGHCPEEGQQGNLNKAVAAVAEYLETLGM